MSTYNTQKIKTLVEQVADDFLLEIAPDLMEFGDIDKACYFVDKIAQHLMRCGLHCFQAESAAFEAVSKCGTLYDFSAAHIALETVVGEHEIRVRPEHLKAATKMITPELGLERAQSAVEFAWEQLRANPKAFLSERGVTF